MDDAVGATCVHGFGRFRRICCIEFYPVQQISVYLLTIHFLILNDIEAWLIFQLLLAVNTFCKIGNSNISILVSLKPWFCFSIWQCLYLDFERQWLFRWILGHGRCRSFCQGRQDGRIFLVNILCYYLKPSSLGVFTLHLFQVWRIYLEWRDLPPRCSGLEKSCSWSIF